MPQTNRAFPALTILFAGSGAASLLYEVAWYQSLQLALGSTTISLAILLSAFLGGLALGSLLFPRLKLAKSHPLKIFAAIETGIALLGFLVTFTLPLLSRVYVDSARNGLGGMLFQGLIAAVVLLPSTILMGASLPALVRALDPRQHPTTQWALLYGANTLGAVAGCLLGGFYLLRVFDMRTAMLAAVAINLTVGALSFLLSKRTPIPTPDFQIPTSSTNTNPLWQIHLVAALSGACALGAEIIWTRLMAYLLVGTVYAFSIILAVFLTGIALGGAVASKIIRKTNPAKALAWTQLFIALAIAIAAHVFNNILPANANRLLNVSGQLEMFAMDTLFCLVAILPAAFLWGVSFPLACAAAERPDRDPARTMGGVYAWNTLGGIVGVLSISLLAIPLHGTQFAQQSLLLLAVLAALILLRNRLVQAIAAIAAIGLTITIPPINGEVVAYGRNVGFQRGLSQVLYVAEGRNSSVAVTAWPNGTLYLNVNGHVEATSELYDMSLQRMVAHLPGIAHPAPKNILGIGFGAGVSAGSFTQYPTVEHITVCEIEPVIPPASAKYFGQQNYNVYSDPRTRIVYDDARHFLMTTDAKYDIIASDPLDVFIKGTAALYTKEYFEAVKRHLTPGGYFSLYVPLYETDERTIRSEVETFLQAFPNATFWSNTRDGLGYDLVFMGQAEIQPLDVDAMQARLATPAYASVRQSLNDIRIKNLYALLRTYLGTNADLGKWSAGADLNLDSNLRLSYLAGWGLNSAMADPLYRTMLSYRDRPTGVFTGKPETLIELLNAIRAASR